MDLISSRNILGKDLYPNFLSADHVLYFPEAVGVIQAAGTDNPNVNDFERMGLGVTGNSYTERTYKDQPWSMEVQYQEWLNRFQAIFTNQNPDDVESEASGADLIMVGGEIGLTESLDIFINQTDRDRTNFVKSMSYLDSTKNEYPTEVPMEGSSNVNLAGTAKRLIMANKPICVEGWGHKLTVEEQSVPDDTVLVGSGPLWLARDPSSYSGTPRKAHYGGGTPIGTGVIGVVASDSRYTSIIAYETSKDGYTDIAWTTVDGTADASPTKPTDGDIEAAVDVLSSGARWCRVADILVDETAPSVVINTADINLAELPSDTFTFYNTALAIPTVVSSSDSWYIFDYALAIKLNGVHKRNTNNISSQDATTIVFGGTITDMVEVFYFTEPTTKWNQLSA